MPIEFRCGQCGKLLRTGDETAGKQAKCPACGAVQPIPASLSSTPLPPGGEPMGNSFGASSPPPPPLPATGGEVNPYQSPLAQPMLDYLAISGQATADQWLMQPPSAAQTEFHEPLR